VDNPLKMRMSVVAILGALVVFGPAVVDAQRPDTSRPPVIASGAGGFSARRVDAPPRIDSREWIEARIYNGVPTSRVRLRDFVLTLVEPATEAGDFQRYRLLFQRTRSEPVVIADLTGWFYVTPDLRYVLTEPLYALDVRDWKQYALFDALHIPNYISIDAISRDRQRLSISRRDCAMDCADQRRDYFELQLPVR
jgi:hypothetical protein